MTTHRELAAGRWTTLSLVEQMGNVGSEVERAVRARRAGKADRFDRAFARALELLDLTGSDPRWRGHRLREIRRAREECCRLLLQDTDEGSLRGLERYFLAFAVAARRTAARTASA